MKNPITNPNNLFCPFQIGQYGQLGSGSSRFELRKDLLMFLDEQNKSSSIYLSLLAVFEEDELFEDELNSSIWRELAFLAVAEETIFSNAGSAVWDFQHQGYRFFLSGTEFFVRHLRQQGSTDTDSLTSPHLAFSLFHQLEMRALINDPTLTQTINIMNPIK